MVQRNVESVDAYLKALPDDARAVIAEVRKVILNHLPAGYEEALNWGMIAYEVPLERYPKTYNGQPLLYAALAAQKNYHSLYLMGVYQDPELEALLRDAYQKSGKKMNMGKSCLRFKSLDDLPLKTIGQIVAHVPVSEFLANYEKSRKRKNS